MRGFDQRKVGGGLRPRKLGAWARRLGAAGALLAAGAAMAFQIAPLGSKFESRLTNETESSLARVAGTLGQLVKSPVHEEITQLGMGCPVDPAGLAADDLCGIRDQPFVTPYVIYGVRWNDLPPFQLSPREGNCSYMGKSCNVQQTVRFSTQPLCWYCLFKDAEAKSQTRQIVGCKKGKGKLRGNVMTRSHFGDLQFLHGMASEEGVHPVATRAEVLDWLEFAWKVSSREIKPQALLREVDIPTIQDRFGCTEWRVSDLYILGRQDTASGLLPQLRHIAFGSVLHTVQDSFAGAHASREAQTEEAMCEAAPFERPPRIVQFHNYGAQDGKLHDAQDSRSAMTKARPRTIDRWPDAVVATRNLAQLHDEGADWEQVLPYMQCLFELAEDRKPSSPGDEFRRVSAEQ